MRSLQQPQRPSGIDLELSRLTERLESDMGGLHAPVADRKSASDKVAISAPPEAILTVGLAICAAAIWLVKVLPY